MIRNELHSKHEKDFSNSYEEPDVWTTTVRVIDPVVEEEGGKKSYTTYKVVTEVRFTPFSSPFLHSPPSCPPSRLLRRATPSPRGPRGNLTIPL